MHHLGFGLWRRRLLRATNSSLRRSMLCLPLLSLVPSCDQSSLTSELHLCQDPDKCEFFSIHTRNLKLCKEFWLDFYQSHVSKFLRVRQDNIQISSCRMLWFASPTTYRSSRIVRKRIDRLFSASMWANILLHLVLELEVRVEEFSALSSKAPSDRNRLTAFGIGRHNLIGMTDGPSVWRCSVHWNCGHLNDDVFSSVTWFWFFG